jgi:hypothetical protein
MSKWTRERFSSTDEWIKFSPTSDWYYTRSFPLIGGGNISSTPDWSRSWTMLTNLPGNFLRTWRDNQNLKGIIECWSEHNMFPNPMYSIDYCKQLDNSWVIWHLIFFYSSFRCATSTLWIFTGKNTKLFLKWCFLLFELKPCIL